MSDLIKENWFVVVIAVLILCGVVYFVQDTTKDNISAKHENGQDVVATLKKDAITADALYEQATPFDAPLLYNMYKKAIIEESVPTTKDLKNEAKSMEQIIESNLKAQAGENYKVVISAELATYGFNGYEDLNEYCLSHAKQKKMNQKFVTKHFDEYKDGVNAFSPRSISLIKVDIDQGGQISEAEQKKMDSIDEALKTDSFAKTATAFSEDPATSSNKGVFGYVDLTDSFQTTGLDASLLQKALELKENETSEWIQVIDQNTQMTSFYKIHVDTTDLKEILNSKDPMIQDRVVAAFLQANSDLEMLIIEDAAKKLDIQFQDKEAQEKVESYIQLMKGETSK